MKLVVILCLIGLMVCAANGNAGECSAAEVESTNCAHGHGRCGKVETNGRVIARCICNPHRYGSRCQLNQHQWMLLQGGTINGR
ncbi:hypothetical protein ACROYT_G022259 [Oculina patagonica]